MGDCGPMSGGIDVATRARRCRPPPGERRRLPPPLHAGHEPCAKGVSIDSAILTWLTGIRRPPDAFRSSLLTAKSKRARAAAQPGAAAAGADAVPLCFSGRSVGGRGGLTHRPIRVKAVRSPGARIRGDQREMDHLLKSPEGNPPICIMVEKHADRFGPVTRAAWRLVNLAIPNQGPTARADRT
jgi:hypothetical protein